jgi:20S proteasome alpha/beta subunit
MKFPIPLRQKRKTPVTLIIGIKCKDAVVLASDSQITYGNAKRTDGVKMTTVYLDPYRPVLLAEAGDISVSSRYAGIFGALAAGKKTETVEGLRSIAQEAMYLLRTEIRSSHFQCTTEELDEIFRKQGVECAIMLGFYLQGKPHIVTVDLRAPLAVISKFYYEAIGCGAPLGQYLLSEHTQPLMDRDIASVIYFTQWDGVAPFLATLI